MIFQNRSQAGEKLAEALQALALRDSFVLAIPRGGVPVAGAVAKTLACGFDVVPLVKMPVPWSPEASYAVAASDGTLALNAPLINRFEMSEREVEMAAEGVVREAGRREALYRKGRPFPVLEKKSVIIVDDGLGSGYSMLAAVEFVKKRNPGAVLVAAPVASDSACRLLAEKPEISSLVVLIRDFELVFSLPAYYKEFPSVTDEDVVRLLSFGKE